MSSYEAAPAAEEVAPADEVADGTASDGEGVDESNEIDPLNPLVDVADGSDQGASVRDGKKKKRRWDIGISRGHLSAIAPTLTPLAPVCAGPDVTVGFYLAPSRA
jgi:hypothetical protein